MMLSTKGRYALMAMVDMVLHGEKEVRQAALIAETQGIALNYLEQLFAAMKKAGLVDSVRGPGGGYKLAKPAHNIVVTDVLRAVGEAVTMAEQSPAIEQRKSGEARLLTNRLWQTLEEDFLSRLQSISLADIAANSFAPAVKEVA